MISPLKWIMYNVFYGYKMIAKLYVK